MITGVKVQKAGGAGNFALRIVPSLTGGGPDFSDDTKFILLTAPASITENAVNTFTAPAGTRLAANTTYHVHVSGTGSITDQPGSMQLTDSDAQDPGAAAGWSIGNESYKRSGTTFTSETSRKLKIAITGNLATTPPPTPANTPPRVANAIVNQTADVGEPFDFTFPASTFTDADGDTLDLHGDPGRRLGASDLAGVSTPTIGISPVRPPPRTRGRLR